MTTRVEPCDPHSIEHGVRQLLADKISGTMVGVWLLIPELLRLGVWDLLCGWTVALGRQVHPRLAMQKVTEAALCVTRLRPNTSLSQKGFELANGLPYIATDRAMYDMLETRTVADSQHLQVALGRVRRASGHFHGRLLAIDPHPMLSSSKRQMPRRRSKPERRAVKSIRGFFCIDADTQQPVCFTLGSSARAVTQATPELLEMAGLILRPQPGDSLLLADSEHFGAAPVGHVHRRTPFDVLVPIPSYPSYQKQAHEIPPEAFHSHWAGMATAKTPFGFGKRGPKPYTRIVQRTGERHDQFRFKSFLSTSDRDAVDALTLEYPERWHAEEFFNTNQDLGWKKGGTMNLNVRYAQMTAALVAQAASSQLRKRLSEETRNWNAQHFAEAVLRGLDGDVRVRDDTILVTYYNAQPLAENIEQFRNMPAQLEAEGVDPRVPWLYGLKLDFRFR